MDFIAATGLVGLLKLDSNHQFFSPCDLEVWWMTLKNYRTPLPYYVKLCTSFQIHRWIQTGFAVWKRSIRFQIVDFLSCVTLKFDGRPWKNNREPLLCCFKLCASFHSHHWIQTGITVRKSSIWVKTGDFFPCDLEIWWMTVKNHRTSHLGQNRRFFVPYDLEILRMTLKNSRAPLLCCFKLCASFHSHHWIQTGVTVRKHIIWVKVEKFLSRVTLKFHGWPWKTIGYLS